MQGTSAIVRTEFAISLGNIITEFQVSFIPLDCSTHALSLLIECSFVSLFSHLLKAKGILFTQFHGKTE